MFINRIFRSLRGRAAARPARAISGGHRHLRAFEVSSGASGHWSVIAGHGGSTGHGSPSRLIG